MDDIKTYKVLTYPWKYNIIKYNDDISLEWGSGSYVLLVQPVNGDRQYVIILCVDEYNLTLDLNLLMVLENILFPRYQNK